MSAHAMKVHGLRIVAQYDETDVTKSTCKCCGGGVRRSWVTHILHDDCRGCRELKMMYGPNIKVVRKPVDKTHPGR